MAELFDKATGKQLATIPDRELADIVFAEVILAANIDFYETLEGDIQLSRDSLDRALRDLNTDPLLDSLKQPTLEMLRQALGERAILDVHFKKDKAW